MKQESCRILHVANDYPFPPNHGGRVDIWRRLQSLTELGCHVDLLVTVKHRADIVQPEYVRTQCNDLLTVDRQLGWRSVNLGTPYQWASRRKLSTLMLPGNYDVLLLESEQCAPILKNPAIRDAKILLRVHNDEADFLSQLGCADSNWIRKQFYAREARLFRKLSENVFGKADRLLFSSSKQHRTWIDSNPRLACKAHWAPPSATARTEYLKLREGATVLFVGGLSSPSNQEAITWYLENIHSELLDVPGYKFLIVGRTREIDLPRNLKLLLQKPAVTVIKDAPNLAPYYRDAAVFVNPMQTGASIKVKTVNALEFAIPTVTTDIGNEGTRFMHEQHVLVANSPRQFSEAVRMLLTNPQRGRELARAGLEIIQECYNHGRLLSNILAQL